MDDRSNKKLAISCVVIVLVVILLIHYQPELEGFADKNEKAKAVLNWFQQNPTRSYTKYKRDMQERSNIVEYYDVMKLAQGRNLTLPNVERVL